MRALNARAAACLGAILAGLCGPAQADPAAPIWPLGTRWETLHRGAAGRPASAPLPRDALLADPEWKSVLRAPRGDIAAVLVDREDRRSVWLIRSGTSEAGPIPPILLAGQTQAERLHWSSDGRWLFLESSTQLSVIAVDGSIARTLLRRPQRAHSRVLGRDPSQDAALLYIVQDAPDGAQPAPHYELRRIGVDGKQTVLHRETRRLIDAAVDLQGQASWKVVVEDNAHLLERIARMGNPVRPGERRGSTWQRLACEAPHSCHLLSVGETTQGIALAHDLDADRMELAWLRGDTQRLAIHRDPHAISELAEVVFGGDGITPLIAQYRSAGHHSHGLDPRTKAALDRLAQHHADADWHIQIGEPGQPWLLRRRDLPDTPQSWHWFDPEGGSLTPASAADSRALRSVDDTAGTMRRWPVAWRASDAMVLYGFLSLPTGARWQDAPVAVLVHGGPWTHVDAGYRSMTDFLVSRGLIVFEPNFRGSTGYGLEYLRAAEGDFGYGRVQQDIDEGLRALLAQGLGDRQRVLLMGASFGGYATLQGVSRRPDLYRAGIAMVPPSDFAWTLDWSARRDDVGLRAGIPLARSLPALGLDPANTHVRSRLREQSPLAHLGALRQPLLMLAGGADQRVALRGLTHYAAALQTAGKSFSLLIDPDSDHALDGPGTRHAMLYLTEAMLHLHFGLDAPSALTAAERSALLRRMPTLDPSLRRLLVATELDAGMRAEAEQPGQDPTPGHAADKRRRL